MYKTAKEMYFAYRCNEYFMKQDDVLVEYKKYNVSIQQQELWKMEYIDRLFDNLEKTKDVRVFSELSNFSRHTFSTDILERLLEYWIVADKSDIEKEFAFTLALLNAINPFTLLKKNVVAKKTLDIVETSIQKVLSNTNETRTNQIAQNCYEEILKLKNRYME